MTVKTILVVDDDPVDIKMIKTRLEKNDYAVVTANSGTEGIERAQEVLPDLIVLDILMPEMDGTEAYSHLKNDPRTSDIPVLFLTAVLTKKEEKLGANVEESFFNVIAKPFDEKEFIQRIRDILGP